MKPPIILFLLLCGTLAKRQHSHNRRPLPKYVLQKLRSISHWLDTRTDVTAFDYIYHVNRGAGLNLYQGDIKGYNPRHRVSIRNHENLWNTRIVPYDFDPGFDLAAKNEVLEAIAEYHNKTCIRFTPRQAEKDYLYFTQIQGCYSNIGRSRGKQEISLMAPCLKKGTAMHEIMHALGFYHEQSRPDRDSWIQVIYANIEQDKVYNFDKLSYDEVDTLGIQYDYGSIMHYSKYAFSRNGDPSLLPIRRTDVQIGQRDGFSDKDIKRINTLYRCSIPAPTYTTHVPVTTTAQTKTTVMPTASTPKQTNPPTSNTHLPQTAAPSVIGWTTWSGWSPCDLSCHKVRYRFCLNNNPSAFCYGSNSETVRCDASCKPSYYLGCWTIDPMNVSIPSVEGQYPTLTDVYKARTEAVRKCADVASENGYTIFALFDGGECLTGPNAHKTFSKSGASNECGYRGKGGPHSVSVYTFNTEIDGQWSAWTAWGQCTRTCGGGIQYRYRQCDNPPPIGNGSKCVGKDIEQKSCNVMKCDENPKCGVRFHTGIAGTSGIINVNDYLNFMQCEYEIITGENLTISLLMTRMDIEYSASCIYDALMIYDGENEASQVMGVNCGNLLPHPVLSSSNKVYIKFEADETTTGSGFTLYYTINNKIKKTCIEPVPPAHCSMTTTSNFVNDTVSYQCEAGYNLIGPSTIICLDQPAFAVWSDMFPVCVRSYRKRSPQLRPKLCTFEGNFCGFTTRKGETQKWSIAKAEPSQHLQRPRKDHNNSENGHFLYVESMRTHKQGDTATVTSKMYTLGSGAKCLSFWYTVYGTDYSTLDVNIKTRDAVMLQPIWSTETEEYGEWRKASVEIHEDNPFQVVLTYTVGEGFGSSAAIDDFIILHGKC